MDFNYQPAWDLICSGNTLGIFQLESSIGQHYSKLVRPHSIPELSDLIALIRPACLQSKMSDGKNMAEHYGMRKSGAEPTTFLIPELEPIVKDTFGIMIYQEQLLSIAKELAGFSLEKADNLRYIIGKKKIDLMGPALKELEDGLINNNIKDADAKQICDWIVASQRYAFNKCLSPNTIVHLPNGTKTIDELIIGEEILSYDLNEKKYIYTTVLDKIESGTKELYEVTVESGKTITCSLDHKFFCEDGRVHPLWYILQKGLRICSMYY